MQFQHYGVIGMKWGVRRYQPYSVTGPRKGGKTGKEIGDAAKTRSKQNDVKSQYINSDGSLTKKGKEVFESKTTVQKKRFQKEAQEHIEQAGATKQKNGDYIIDKDKLFFRVTDKEESMEGSKYVSMTAQDRKEYNMLAGELVADADHARLEIYKSDMPMKVASGKKVMNYLLDNYGDTKVKDILQQEYVNAKNSKYNKKIMKMIDQDGEFKVKDLYFDELTKDISYNKTTFGQHNKDVFSKDPDTAFAATRYNTTIEVGGKFVAEYLMKNEKTKKETLDYFAKKGYDAIIDVDDARFLSEFPLILLNPKNTTTKVFSEEFRKKKTKIADEPIKIK